MTLQESQIKLKNYITKNLEEFQEISTFIFNNPELGGEEYKSSSYLGQIMTTNGFDVTFPYESLPTAFVADYTVDSSYPTFAFLAEYDALPGYEGKNAHACGHNWIAGTMAGCAISLSKVSKDLKFNVKLIGTPAEETFGGKCDMVELGTFYDVDYVMQAHLDKKNCMYVNTLAMNSIEFTFKGVSSHAAQSPEKGVNALDSVISMFVNVGLLRQQITTDARIHGIITNGGEATNIIPDLAKCKFTIRANDKNYLSSLRNKLINIAKGAALSSGATLTFEDFENPFDNIINLSKFVTLCENHFKSLGVTDFMTPDDPQSPGSSDIGNVSQICPTLYAELALEVPGSFPVHHPNALILANSSVAKNKMAQTIKAFSMTVLDIATNPQLQEEIKNEFINKKQKNS